MPHSDVIIIGGGAIGLSSAYYINRMGYEVTVIDNNTPDQYDSCSWGSSGMIVPSHIVPLAAPGVIKQGLKWLLDPESPFSIEFRPTFEMISWLWKFRKAANSSHVKDGADLLRRLSMHSRSLYLELDETMDFGLETDGILMLCNREDTLKEELAVSAMARDIGMTAEDLNPSEVNKLETGMLTDIAGGVHYPMDCHVNPVSYLLEMKKVLLESNVKIIHETKVEGLSIENGKVISVTTAKETWTGKNFVLSAGSFSAKLINKIKLKMPLMAGKGYSVTMESPPQKPAIPAILVEARIASTPMGHTWRFGGTMTVTQGSRLINQRKLNAMLRNVKNYYPEYDLSWTESLNPWVGLRPLSADGLPYIGAFQEYPNLFAATGHAMLGVSLAPLTGYLISQIVAGKSIDYDMRMLSPDRF